MRYLIVRLGAIGDIVMTLPVVAAIRENDSEAHISWLCGKSVAPILKKISGIDAIIEVDEVRLFRASQLVRIAELLKIMRQLAGRRFEKIFTFYKDWRYQILSALAVGTRRSLSTRGYELAPGRSRLWEHVRFTIDFPQRLIPMPVLPALNWPISEELSAANEWDDKRAVIIAPGGAKNILRDDAVRRWPIERYHQVAEILIEQGHQVVLIGAPSDAWVQPYFVDLEVIDLVGKTSLPDLIGLMQRVALVVTHDTGTAHLARLANVAAINIFGPTNPAEFLGAVKWGNQEANTRSVTFWGGADLGCRPCYDGRNFADCDDNQCVKQISAAQVVEAAQKILSP